MNKDIFQGDWKILKGKIKEKWGKLTEDDLTEIKGKKDQLLGKLQKRYGLTREKAQEACNEWEKSCSCNAENNHSKAEHNHSGKSYR